MAKSLAQIENEISETRRKIDQAHLNNPGKLPPLERKLGRLLNEKRKKTKNLQSQGKDPFFDIF